MISPLRMIYLALAVLGAVIPWFWFIQHFQTGAGLSGLLQLWFATPGQSGATWDIVIGATALVIWIIAETRVRRNWSALWAIAATFLAGPGCGLPLYLFLRTRPI